MDAFIFRIQTTNILTVYVIHTHGHVNKDIVTIIYLSQIDLLEYQNLVIP